MGNMGIWQEVLVLPEKQCFKIPDSLSLKEAAALPVNYVTSSIMLFDQACLKEGQSVLIHMAAGNLTLPHPPSNIVFMSQLYTCQLYH